MIRRHVWLLLAETAAVVALLLLVSADRGLNIDMTEDRECVEDEVRSWFTGECEFAEDGQ